MTMFRPYRVLTGMFLIFAVPLLVKAEPPQRLVIQFQHPLTEIEQQEFSDRLKSMLPMTFERAGHSSNDRWILILHSKLQGLELKALNEKIESLEQVKFSEPDRLMKPVLKIHDNK